MLKKTKSRCAAHRDCGQGRLDRRGFLAASSASILATSVLGGRVAWADAPERNGPGAVYVPKLKGCFIRRKGEYGMRWPGQIFDGEAARKKYLEQFAGAATRLGVESSIHETPLYSAEEGDAWLAETVKDKPDGLVVVALDRQEHTWPTIGKIVDARIPTVVVSPLGTSFSTPENVGMLAGKPGCFVCSTNDFAQVEWGMKMLAAGARIRESRCLVIAGARRREVILPHLGTRLQYVPARSFLEEYEKTPVDDAVRAMARELIDGARQRRLATDEDVINGIKSYRVAQAMMARERADGITMDCLGALGRSKVSLPCIAWSKMNDDAIPAACEADLGAMASQLLAHRLFDRPGFQQDPVAETARDAVIGAHCSCPTRLAGFSAPSEPYDLLPHHGARDATRRTLWKPGQRVTMIDVLPGGKETPTKVLVDAGEVIDNLSAPPSGGCVVSVMVKFDSQGDVLAYPGFHQLFFYGDFKKPMIQYCRLFGLEPVVV
ncbi:MAG: hypothetical protein JW809_04635 [Pirellulales bacterium]|nr:hypothetical protein [Pirellulales bacterium]